MNYLILIFFAISYFYPIGTGNFLYGTVVYPILTILLAVISKKIFKKSFDPSYWKGFFVVSIIFAVIALVLAYLSIPDVLPHLLNRYVEADESMAYLVRAMMFNLGSFIFFICYLINFLVRLVHHRKQKNSVISEETKMN